MRNIPRYTIYLVFICACAGGIAFAQDCEYSSFLDAIPGNVFGDTSIFKTAIKISGYQDKLPDPSSNVAITLLVPTNGAFLKMLWDNGFFIPIISKVGDALPATVLYNTMLGSIPPEQVALKTSQDPGSSSSIYGLLSGNAAYNLEYYAEQKDGETFYYFRPEGLNGAVAETKRPVKVCNSWVYFTNRVLVPSSNGKLGEVVSVTIPENLPWSDNSGERDEPVGSPLSPALPQAIVPSTEEQPPLVPAVPPSPPVCQVPDPELVVAPPGAIVDFGGEPSAVVDQTLVVEDPASMVSSCNTTFADAARDAGLGLLATALSQEAISSRLPDPSLPNTLFAPVDTAFFNMLTDLGISITDALGLGDKLAGVILYHVHPNEALSAAQIQQKESLTTALGQTLGQTDMYTIGVQNDANGAKLVGRRPGNVATITQELQVCGASVLVIDSVLVPAENIESLPDPGPQTVEVRNFEISSAEMESAVTQPRSAGGILTGGIASGIGALADCLVELTAVDAKLNATTDSSGRFSFDSIPECAIETGLLELPTDDRQFANCRDLTTGLPPPYTFIADLSNLLGNLTSMPSTENPINLNALSTLLSSLTLGASSSEGITAVTDEIAGLLGFDSAQGAVLGDFINNITSNDWSLTSIIANSQALVSSLLGANSIEALIPGIDFDEAVSAIDEVIASGLQSLLDLSDPQQIQAIIETAIREIQPDDGSRKRQLLQGSRNNDSLGPISKSIADINSMMKEYAASNSNNPADVASFLGKCVDLSQSQIAPAIREVGTGVLASKDFQSSFGTFQLRQMVNLDTEEIVAEGSIPISPLPIQVEEVVQAPSPEASSGTKMRISSARQSIIMGIFLLFAIRL
eukprot:jgi/Picsp_1/6697/NSC_04039-R1_hypothetical protein CHLNCDRAFT_144241 [Chlorella variabilis]